MALSGAERFDKALDPVSGDRDRRDYETVTGSLDSSVNLFNGFGDIAALRGCDAFFGNVSDRAIAAGCAYLEMCERLGPGARCAPPARDVCSLNG